MYIVIEIIVRELQEYIYLQRQVDEDALFSRLWLMKSSFNFENGKNEATQTKLWNKTTKILNKVTSDIENLFYIILILMIMDLNIRRCNSYCGYIFSYYDPSLFSRAC